MFNSDRKGFSLMGIVIIVVVVLGAISFFVFGNFIESSRVTDVERLISAAVESQGRQLMRKGNYTKVWSALDASQLAPYVNKKGEYVSQDGKIFMSKGGGMDKPNNGFKMYFDEIDGEYFIVAERVNSLYTYTLVRPMKENTIYCLPKKGKKPDVDFCKKYMDVSSAAALPADPRPIFEEEEE